MRVSNFAAAGDFWRVVREFNPEGIEREATASLDLWIVGEPGSGKHTLARSLLGVDGAGLSHSPLRIVDLDLPGGQLPSGEKPDLIALVVKLDERLPEVGGAAAELLGRIRIPLVLLFTHADKMENTRDFRNAAYRAFSFVSHLRTAYLDARDPGEVQAALVPILLESVPALRTPLARQIPAVRSLVAEQIIAETCRVNAQFALAASLPAGIPLLGGVASNVADFFVLTKNQVMMVFRLAAIHGRDISLTRQVAAEIAPVIGAGLMWRTAARMAVGMLPGPVGLVPKAAIAYVGTYVAGHAARFYYDQGRKPPAEVIRALGQEGTRLYRTMMSRGPSG